MTQSETTNSDVDEMKGAAARWAVSQLKNGMVVGLGSRSTAALAVSAIAQRVREGLHIIGIPTSEKTLQQAQSLEIPLSTLAQHPDIDITIDGADEVELDSLSLIKGGGGNLLREKIVAIASKQVLIIVDQNKLVSQLGSRAPLPVEVTQFGWESTAKRLAALGATPVLRVATDQQTFLTDAGNYILDCIFGPIKSARSLGEQLDSTVGVVEQRPIRGHRLARGGGPRRWSPHSGAHARSLRSVNHDIYATCLSARASYASGRNARRHSATRK